jgi:hypothetical protein
VWGAGIFISSQKSTSLDFAPRKLHYRFSSLRYLKVHDTCYLGEIYGNWKDWHTVRTTSLMQKVRTERLYIIDKTCFGQVES